jgi:predicted RNase H-like HicB family nuclease
MKYTVLHFIKGRPVIEQGLSLEDARTHAESMAELYGEAQILEEISTIKLTIAPSAD